MKKIVKVKSEGWRVKAMDPPILSRQDWMVAGALGILFILMAVAQLISFSDFKETLESLGVSGATAWAFSIILAELFASAGFFRIRLSYLARVVSGSLALLVSGFWFVLMIQAVSGTNSDATGTGLFGRFLDQPPGWWTVIQATLLLFWTMYAVALTRYTMTQSKGN